jgi:DNA-directed RNA polymerase specialized sigma24 family protein
MSKTHYDKEEACQLLRGMTQADKNKAVAYAGVISSLASGEFDPEELFYEALTRTMEGRRKWKRTMGLAEHLFGAMRSIQSSWLKSQKRGRVAVVRYLHELRTPSEEMSDEFSEEVLTEMRERAHELLNANILNEQQKLALRSLVEGQAPGDILANCGLSEDEYTSLLRACLKYIYRH